MNARMVVRLGVGIGLTALFGCTDGNDHMSVPLVAAPTRLVPEAYNAPPTVVADATAPAVGVSLPAAPMPVVLPDPSRERQAAPAVDVGLPAAPMPQVTAMKSDHYHPSWVVAVH